MVWTGCATRASKPLPILRVILTEKGIFSGIFLKIRPVRSFFTIFGVFAMLAQTFWLSHRNGYMFTYLRIFLLNLKCPGATRMARGGIRLVHGLTKSTLITYFSCMKIDPKYAFLHELFLICLSYHILSKICFIWPKTHFFFSILHVFAPLNGAMTYVLSQRGNPSKDRDTEMTKTWAIDRGPLTPSERNPKENGQKWWTS